MNNRIIGLDINDLKDYKIWEASNKNNWSILSYVNQFTDANTALSLAHLFFPEIVEVNGCLIFEFKFLEDTFDQWEREFKGNQQKIETMCNWSYVYDIFHINSPDVSDKELASLAKVLSFTWSLTFERLYPDRNYTVDAFLDMEDWVITAYRD